jgi:hypothetical protein
LDRAADSESRQRLHFRIAGPASFLGRPRLGREPQPFACRRPRPVRPAAPAKQAWLKHPWRNSPATQEANRPPLLTGPALRIRDPRSDHQPGLFLQTFLATIRSSFLKGSKSAGNSAGRVATASLPFLSTTQRDTTWNRTHSQPSISLVAAQYHHRASGRCRFWTLDTPLGSTTSPNLRHPLFRQWWGSRYRPLGFAKPLTSTCFNFVRTWLILVNRIERGRRMRQHHATTPCMGRLGPGPEGDAGVLF